MSWLLEKLSLTLYSVKPIIVPYGIISSWYTVRLQQVEEDVGLSVGAAWIAGQDRSMWRTLRPSAGQAQQ